MKEVGKEVDFGGKEIKNSGLVVLSLTLIKHLCGEVN